MKKILIVLLLPLFSHATETAHYCLGRIHLAGMVPEKLPVEGSPLHLHSLVQPLLNSEGEPVGYIPSRYLTAVQSMRASGLQLQLEVEHVYRDPLPGKYISVEVWVTTDRPELLRPLLYNIPALPDDALTASRD